jgi:hypothetical protein
MKCLAACSLLLFFIQMTHAQNDPAAQQFIRSVIYEKGVVYTDSVENFGVNEARRAFNEQLNSDQYKSDTNSWVSGLHLTNAEIDSIKNQTTLLNNFTWKAGLINNAIFVPQATINKIFNDGSKGWDYFRKHYGSSIYAFGKPIFIRNHTVCYFYMDNSCGNQCYGGSFEIYIKSNGKWIRRYTILTWVT